jgi:peptidoglycan/xylan/chitin deacetylase (PgdA/CDA1 family)
MISNEPNGFYPEVSTGDFEKHISHLSKYYTIISLDEFVYRVKNYKSLRGCVVITFDDGFKDNYLNAYPILKKYNAPATIFLTTGRIEDGEAPWFIRMRFLFLRTAKKSVKLKLADRTVLFQLETASQRLSASMAVMSFLHEVSDETRENFLACLDDTLSVTKFQDIQNLMLDWKQISQMSMNGISFGAHTINHPIMSRLPLKRMEDEIIGSKELIEKKIGQPVFSFSYPFGKKWHYNQDCIKILNQVKIQCAVTTELGPNTTQSHLFELNRCIQGKVRPYDFYWHPYSL